ncbi:hypothetical protein PCANC_06939 [Puccinia coronata f. sp. avenae]|uniref:Uncharacterized protein n=1 Tax=Puccinia coronata f. sp. avenae TaxID=200324 RepID=A0A2N5VKR1_9BASI|nr:hypothetical protein PCANC_06939 [Puccinia coronata f. sp. avenae]
MLRVICYPTDPTVRALQSCGQKHSTRTPVYDQIAAFSCPSAISTVLARSDWLNNVTSRRDQVKHLHKRHSRAGRADACNLQEFYKRLVAPNRPCPGPPSYIYVRVSRWGDRLCRKLLKWTVLCECQVPTPQIAHTSLTSSISSTAARRVGLRLGTGVKLFAKAIFLCRRPQHLTARIG